MGEIVSCGGIWKFGYLQQSHDFRCPDRYQGPVFSVYTINHLYIGTLLHSVYFKNHSQFI